MAHSKKEMTQTRVKMCGVTMSRSIKDEVCSATTKSDTF
jgi:hypothetical protein